MNEKEEQMIHTAEQDETSDVGYAMHVVDRLLGATIVGVGSNEQGEILLSIATKDGGYDRFIFGVDENSEVAIFGVEDDE